jgi:hypothetical protein
MNVHDIHLTEPALAEAIAENVHGNAGHRHCDDYIVPFGKRAEALVTENKPELADAFRFLGAVTSLHLKPDDQYKPFVPFLVTPAASSPGIDDLTDEQVAVVAQVAGMVDDPELRARLADLVWIREKDYRLAQVAVVAYTNSAKEILAGPLGSWAIERFERALQIVAMLGRQQPLFEQTAAVVEGIASDGNEKAYTVARCLDLLLKFGIGNPQTLAQIAETRATGDESRNKPLWQRRFWDLVAKFYDRAKQADDAKRARIEVAKTFEAEAEEALRRNSPPSHLVATTFLENAIQAYRRVPGTEADRDRVHRQLLDCQKKAVNEIRTTTAGTIDLSDIAHQSMDLVRGKPLSEALRTLALSVAIPSKAQLRADAEETIGRSPLVFLFPTNKLSRSGKVVAKQAATSSSTSDEDKESLILDQMFWNAFNQRQVVVVGQIEPMRQQVLAEHHVRYDDFLPLVAYNRFVPPGRELFFVRGLHDGLHGNLVGALHILVPQLENSIRCLLTDLGVVTSSLDADGIQKEHDINMMLYEPRLAEVFTEDIIFTLRGLLVERAAANFRNQLAHGMLEYGAFFGETALYIWWLVLHLCVLAASQAHLTRDE